MDCFNPRTIRLPDGRWQPVRCNKCLACLSYRQGGWLVRIRQEIEDSAGAYFVTLTYNDDHLPMFQPHDLSEDPIPCVSKKDIQKLHMDMRKRFQQGFYTDHSLVPFGGKPITIDLSSFVKFKYYLTSELGPHGNRPHYHGLYFHLPDDPFLVENLFRSLWGKGFVYVEPARTEAAGAYVTKYLINDSFVPLPSYEEGYPRMFALMSKGLGKSYLLNDTLVDWHRSAPLDRCFHPKGKDREVLPRYWKDRIFDDDMRASLLDKAVEREEVHQEYLSGLSLTERRKYEEDLQHSQDEAVRQAEWRFLKNGKLK